MATSDTLPALQAMRAAADQARNDEILEVAIFVHDLMVDRCENAVDLAIEADDRDAMNEASVLVRRAKDLLPSWLGNKNRCSSATYWRWHDVDEEIGEAISDSRAGSPGPAPAGRAKARGRRVAPIKERDEVALEPFTDDELVQALAKACRDWDEYAVAHHGANRSPGAMTSSIAEVLAGGSWLGDNRVIVRHGDVIRVGQRLGKLMREGRIACLSASYEARRYGLADA